MTIHALDLVFALSLCLNLQMIFWLEMRNSNIFQLCLWISASFFSLPFSFEKIPIIFWVYLTKPNKQSGNQHSVLKIIWKFKGIFYDFQVISGSSITKTFIVA